MKEKGDVNSGESAVRRVFRGCRRKRLPRLLIVSMNQLGNANPTSSYRARRKRCFANPSRLEDDGPPRITSDGKLVVIGSIGNLANDTIKLLMAHWLR